MRDEWKCVSTKLGVPFVPECIMDGGGILIMVGDHLIVLLCADNLDIWN